MAEKETKKRDEQVDTQEQEKMVSVSEMQRRLDKEKRRQSELEQAFEEYKNGEGERIKDALDAFQKEQEMNADELAEFKRKEAEKEWRQKIEAKEKEIQALKDKEKKSEIKNIAVSKLNEKNILVDDDTLSLVIEDDIEKTVERIEALNKLLNSERVKYIGIETPRAGGNTLKNKSFNSVADILDGGRIIK